ncbi:hypothetical protein SPD48_06210 [Pseudogracilibacillus sp. SE30717A]|uniref:hypothetical protein n=1 Tax=Pseudogracilibacillus sp. SE30717A TaxID=3098293 RepID=UPI00300DFD4D
MFLGTNKIDITPELPINLAGFAHREGLTNEVENHLFIKTFYFKVKTTKIIMIVADLIWWGDQLVCELQNEIEDHFSIPKDHICFHATHNHSGPQTSLGFSKKLGEISSEFLDLLKKRVIISVEKAIKNIEKVSIERRTGTSQLGIYRRKLVNNRIIMAPNEKVPNDNGLNTISFKTEEGKVKAIWIHYSCHPTTTDANVISSEYPGVCCQIIEKYYPKATVAFLQGFCADVRPALVQDGAFYRGSLQHMKRIGECFAQEVLNVLMHGKKITIKEKLQIENKELVLPFDDNSVNEYIPIELKEEWPKIIKQNRQKKHVLHFQYIKLGENLSFIGCNAELSQAYGVFLKKLENTILPLGYTNGMVGYVATKKQTEAGGYEPVDSIFYFGLPAMLALDTEEKINDTFKTIIGGE